MLARGMLPTGLLLAVLSCGGCLSRPSLTEQSFAFGLPPLMAKAPPAGKQHVLEMRQLRVAAPFDSQAFVYRTGAYSYERDPYAQFLVPPAESLQAPLQGYFRDSGIFGEVVNRGSVLQADTLVEIYISGLFGDFSNRAAPAAVLRMRFNFFAADRDLPAKVLLQKDYEQRVRLKARTAAAVMAGWNEALKRIMRAVTADLKTRKS